MKSDVGKLDIMTGMPCSGKTTLGLTIAKEMLSKGNHAIAVDQDILEEDRRVGRDVIETVERLDISDEFKQECRDAYSDSRPAFLRTLSGFALSFLQQGQDVIMMVNFRERDIRKLDFFGVLNSYLSEHMDRKVEVIGVHLKSDVDGNLSRLKKRGVEADTIHTKSAEAENAFRAGLANFSEHGPLYSADPTQSYEHIVLDPWKPHEKSPQELAADFFAAEPHAKGFVISPSYRPVRDKNMGKELDRSFPTVLRM